MEYKTNVDFLFVSAFHFETIIFKPRETENIIFISNFREIDFTKRMFLFDGKIIVKYTDFFIMYYCI